MHYDKFRERSSIDEITPAEWDAMAKKQRDEYFGNIPERKTNEERIAELIGTNKDIQYKYNEAKLIQEFQEYVDSTYGQHYSKDKFQATEFIIDGGHGTGFCIGNVLKYAQRYGKKGTAKDARKDLMKVLHYALIQLHIHDTENS